MQTIITTLSGDKRTIYAVREERGLFTVYQLRSREDVGTRIRTFPTRVDAEMYIDHTND